MNIHAQFTYTVPDRALVDQKILLLCKLEVENIESMQLKCDTLYFKRDSFYFNTHHVDDDWFTGLYYDNKGRLRKNIKKWAFHDGSNEYVDLISYYNANGDLVYVEMKSGCNCDDEKEYIYLHNRQIVDWGYAYDCGCCEEEDVRKHIETESPTLGDIVGDEWKYSVSAKNLLNSYFEYYQYAGNVMPGVIIPQKKEPFFRDEKDMKSLPSFSISDSIDNPKTFLIKSGNHPYTTNIIAIKKNNQYATFKLFPDGVRFSEYEISRQNIDNVGNDELVIRWKNSGDENGIVVWNLDTYSCILNIYETKYQHYGEAGYIANGTGHNVDLTTGRLTVQIVKNRKEDILGLKYIYKYTESGFVLEKVE